MMPDLIELLQAIEHAVHNNTPVPARLLEAIMQTGVDLTQSRNPDITREEAVNVFMKLVREKLKNARKR